VDIHVFHEASELRQFLRNFRREHERAETPSDFQHASLDEILNCSSNRYAANAKSRQQFIFTR
jgi:hypothetical protein